MPSAASPWIPLAERAPTDDEAAYLLLVWREFTNPPRGEEYYDFAIFDVATGEWWYYAEPHDGIAPWAWAVLRPGRVQP